jgi:hypothetical protein
MTPRSIDRGVISVSAACSLIAHELFHCLGGHVRMVGRPGNPRAKLPIDVFQGREGVHFVRIAEHWGSNDDLGLMRRLGVIPDLNAVATA